MPRHEVSETPYAFRVPRPNEDGDRPQVQRLGVAQIECARQRLGEVAHHVLGAAEDDVGVLPGLFDPLRGRTGHDVNGDVVRGRECLRRFLDRRRGSTGAVDVDDLVGQGMPGNRSAERQRNH